MSQPIAHPFDTVAADYDPGFTRRRLGRWLRAAVWEWLADAFRLGDRVLELGCGTGEDAIWLARRGVQVVATDAAPRMLAVAQRKAAAAGVADRIVFERLDLSTLGDRRLEISAESISNLRSPISTPYDGAFSNFGALNCLPDRRPLAEALARWVRPGGRVVLVVMGPLCPWELAWYLLHGAPRTAFRRLRPGGIEAHIGTGATVRVWYPSPRRLRAEFVPGFRHLETAGIGAFLPPSYLDHLVERWPPLFEALAHLDRRFARTFPWTWLNDHYLAVFERR
jgi:SAM-dependent methyltransferase